VILQAENADNRSRLENTSVSFANFALHLAQPTTVCTNMMRSMTAEIESGIIPRTDRRLGDSEPMLRLRTLENK
jgi:hypothetical protein